MSLIDDYERQLVDAAERRYGRRPRRFAGRHRRGLAVAIAALVVAVPATAGVTEWDPFEGPGRPSATGRPVDPALVAQLGVLRRDQTPTDRAAITRERLRSFDNGFRGARIDGIRLLDADRGVALVPFEEAKVPRDPTGRPLPGFGGREFRNVVCVVQPTSDGGLGAGCHSADKIARGLALGSGAGQVDGLVPDGVARVRLIRGREATAEADVRNNYFYVDGSRAPTVVEWLGPDGTLVRRIDLNA